MIVVGNELFFFFFFLQPGKTLSARKWHAAFSPDGQLDLGKTLGRIQRGVSLCLTMQKLPATMIQHILHGSV